MRIKYLGAKVAISLVTVLATPVVWAALAWPEWQSAAPPEFAVETAQAVAPPPTEEAPAAIPQVIRQVIVVPRYVVVEAPAASSNSPSPAGTAPPLPTAVPVVVPQRVEPAPQPTQKPAAAAGSGSTGTSAQQSTSSSSAKSSSQTKTSKPKSTTRGS